MKFSGATDVQLQEVADLCKVRLVRDRGGDGWVLRPSPDNNSYRRLSWSSLNPERRVNATCWHGHRSFLGAAFTMIPGLRVYTMAYDPARGKVTRRMLDGAAFTAMVMATPKDTIPPCNCGPDTFKPVKLGEVA